MKYLSYITLIVFLAFSACNNPAQKEKNKPQKPTENTTADNTGNNSKIKVGVFSGNGAGSVSVIETIEALKIDPEITAYPISPADIITGKLAETDAIIFPGGSGSKQLNSLGKTGKQKVVDYIKQGGGAIGICAGAYMMCQTDGYPSLKIGDVKHLDRPHYNRGRGLIEFKLNDEGLKIFPEFKDQPQFIQYYDGPIMAALNQEKSFKPVAVYVTDIHPNEGDPVGLTPGKLFMYHQNYGKGKIFAIGGHAESTPGIRFMIPRMARWVTGNKLVSYDAKWIHPERNNRAILFDSDLKKKEKELFWSLFDDDPQVREEAMSILISMRSRPAVRWCKGLLRDDDPNVRIGAAQSLIISEYTDALKDLKASYKVETDPDAKKVMKRAIDFLQY